MRKLWIVGLLLLLMSANSVFALTTAHDPHYSGNDPLEQGESSSASVRVIPSSGAPGSTHTVIITGLQPNEQITVRVMADATNQMVYSTSRTADNNSRVQFDIFTTRTDPPGNYTVEAISRSGRVLGSAPLTITEIPGREGVVTVSPESGEAGTSFTFAVTDIRPFADLEFLVRDAASQQIFSIRVRADVDGTASVAYPSDPNLNGTYTVVVRDGGQPVATTTFAILEKLYAVQTIITPEEPYPLDEVFVTFSGLEPDTPVLVEILHEDVVISTESLQGDENGFAILSFPLERDVPLGEYEIRVMQGDELVSRALYRVDMPQLSAKVSPTEGMPGTRFTVDVSGLLPEETVTVELFKDGEAVVSVPVTGSAEGTARTLLGQRMLLEPGNYTVRVLRGETVSFSTPVAIVTERSATEAAVIDPAQVVITVDPLTGPIPTNYTVRVEGVPANTDLTLAIVYQGRAVLTLRGTADADGVYESVVTSEATDPPGTYTFEVRANGELIGSADFAIADETTQVTPEAQPETESATLAITPSTVARGETFTLTVSRLNAGEEISLDVVFDGASVYSTTRAADADGNVMLELAAEAGDPAGTYGVVVIRADGSTLQGAFTIVEVAAQATTTPPPATDSTTGAAVTIVPAQAAAGSIFSVEASGFPTGARVDVEVRYQGEVVYSDTRNADVNGILRANIPSAADAPDGEYQVVLLRGGEVVATASYLIGEGGTFQPTPVPSPTPIPTQDAQTSTASVTVDPVSGAVGTTHAVTLSGATAGAEVLFDVQFGGTSVYQTTRTTDANGAAVVLLVTEAGDPAGVYEVSVTDSSGNLLGSTQFTLEAQTAQPTPVPTQDAPPTETSAVSVNVAPTSGTVGTTHTVTVSGAVAGTELLFDVRFGDRIVYQTSRIVEADGSAVLILITEDGDTPGTYEVDVRDSSGNLLGSTAFMLEAETAQPTPVPTQDAQPAQGSVTVDPVSGTVGTTHVVSVTGLPAGVEVLFDVRFDGSTVYRTSRTTDASGSASVSLVTHSDDPAGTYEVIVSTSAGVIGSTAFMLDDGTMPPTPVPTEEATPVPTEEPTPEPTRQPTTGGDGVIVVDGQLNQNVPEFRYNFDGSAGESVLISVNASDFDTYLRLLDRNGNEIAYNDDSAGTLNSQIGPFSLPTSGTYTVVVTSYAYYSYGEASSGSFVLTIERIALSQIAYGDTRQIDLNAEMFSQFLSFSGSAGDVISVTVDSGGSVDTVLSLIDPDGATVFMDDDGGAGFDPEIMRYVLSASGDYTLVLRAYTPGESGTVALRLVRSDSRSLDGEIRNVRLNTKQSSDVLTLRGSAGQTIGLEVRLMSGDVGNLSITAEQAGVQLMYYNTAGVPDTIVLGFEVPADGDVTIRIEDYSTTGSSYDVLIRQD